MSRNVLITGAAGRIGSSLTRDLAGRYSLSLTDVRPPADPRGNPFAEADIADLDAMCRLCQGVDTIVHLAAKAGVRPSLADPVGYATANVTGTSATRTRWRGLTNFQPRPSQPRH